MYVVLAIWKKLLLEVMLHTNEEQWLNRGILLQTPGDKMRKEQLRDTDYLHFLVVCTYYDKLDEHNYTMLFLSTILQLLIYRKNI